MKVIVTILTLATACAVLLVPMKLQASENVGIYAIVERVVLEPDSQNPQRIQLWGVFATDRTTASPKKGYMYFTLPASQQSTARKEWADFMAVAGTGRAVGFGMSFFSGQNQAAADAYHSSLGHVRIASEKPTAPDVYPINFGVTTVTNPTIVELLKSVLRG